MSYEQNGLDGYTDYFQDLLRRLYDACTSPSFFEDYWMDDIHDDLMLEVQEALGETEDPRDA